MMRPRLTSLTLALLLLPGCGEGEIGGDDPAGPREPFARGVVSHILLTGQSLSVGADGVPALSRRPMYGSRMFQSGVTNDGERLRFFVPLAEQRQETMASGLANLVGFLSRAGAGAALPGAHDVLVSGHGVPSMPYSQLKKGTSAYENGLQQIRAGRQISASLGLGHVVRALAVVHGESDAAQRNPRYAEDLAVWQTDYERDARALTGQSEPVPMFHSQISSWTYSGLSTTAIPQAQLDASLKHPGSIFLVGPKYFLPYRVDDPKICIHLSNHGYRWLGEYYAKAYRQVVLEGRPWLPLYPKTVSVNRADILVDFHVPSPPLVLDTTAVSDPGSYGFEYWEDGAARPKIVAVALTGPTSVRITLSRAPTGKNRRIRYAHTGVKLHCPGPELGPRGNLRDSDRTPSLGGYSLYNWAVHFDLPVPE